MDRLRRGLATLLAMTMMMALMAVGPTGAVAAVGDTLYRINVGGPDVAVSGEDPFLGVTLATLDAVAGLTITGDYVGDVTIADAIDTATLGATAPEEVYQTLGRTGNTAGHEINFAFTVPNGDYEVKLHWTEHNTGTNIGDRVFDIDLEGVTVLDDYDILDATGGVRLVAITETLPVYVSDGVLNLDLVRESSVAIIRGIEIVEAAPAPDTTAPVLTLIGNDPLLLLVGDLFTDPGAEATDNVDPTTTVYTTDSVNTAIAGDYLVSYDHIDVAGNPATTVPRTVRVLDAGDFAYRVNPGGPDIDMGVELDFLGLPFADLAAISGLTASGDIAAEGVITDAVDTSGVTVPELVFQSLLRTTATTGQVMNFAFDLPNGDYEVRLHWMEQNDSITSDGRLFDVTVEGVLFLDDYDMFDESKAAGDADGYFYALTEEKTTTVSDGQLNVDIEAVTSVAIIRGIEIVVVDTTAPVIDLIGDNPMTHEAGDPFTDPGADVTDNVDPATTITGASTVVPDVPGDYTITYDYTDAAGNPAMTVVRNVDVVDTTAPLITLLGDDPMTVLQGTTFVDPGAEVTDNVDATSTIAGVSTVNTALAGDYTVTYDYTDSATNPATTVVRDVTVTADLPPVITLLGANPLVIEGGDTYVEAGATANDVEDGDLSSSIVTDSSAVNTAVVGDYEVTYTVTDSFGNITVATRDVEVVDTTDPIITLLGANPLILDVGDTFTDPGATVTDNVDASSTIIGVSTVNTSVAGDYTVTYDYTDAAGNAAATVVRDVEVVDTAPVDTFTDDNDSIFEEDIEWLAAHGITKGCNPPVNDMFCPTASTTRGQMAAFFNRALGDVLTVDMTNAIAFTDTATSVFEQDIAWLSAAGITQGCNPPANDMFCATDLVTRGQMAAFLHRAFGDLIPAPTPSGTVFTDTATSEFVTDIQWLADTGITKGCGTDTFCPDANVTRGQMAAFLRRAFAAAGLS